MNAPLVRTLRVRCPIDHAFTVFTERVDLWWPPSHRRFGTSTMRLDASRGGAFVELAADGRTAHLGDVVACEPPKRIVYTWTPGALTAPTTVEVCFAPDGEHTTVVVTHSEGESALGARWPDRVALFTKGWETVLPAFAAHIERASDVGAASGSSST